jgi:hypothetical protein
LELLEPFNTENNFFASKRPTALIAGFLILTFTGRNVLATLRRLLINNV